MPKKQKKFKQHHKSRLVPVVYYANSFTITLKGQPCELNKLTFQNRFYTNEVEKNSAVANIKKFFTTLIYNTNYPQQVPQCFIIVDALTGEQVYKLTAKDLLKFWLGQCAYRELDGILKAKTESYLEQLEHASTLKMNSLDYQLLIERFNHYHIKIGVHILHYYTTFTV
jgi:hypothetical protein